VTFVVKPHQVARAAGAAVKHVKVYHADGRFAGWPANHGIWSWGNEILVGFGRGYYKDRGDSHNIDLEKPQDHLLARSLDGGETWTIEDPAAAGHLIPGHVHLFGTVRESLPAPAPTACPGGIDFEHPDFGLTLRMFSRQAGQSWFSYSYDRGKSWQGPYSLPGMGTGGIEARTNYLVGGKHDCTVFLSAVDKELSNDPKYRNRPFCARTSDGGKTWQFVSWIGPPLVGNAIMPTAARVTGSELLCVLRRRVRSQEPQAWLAAFASPDNGRTWRRLANPVDNTGVGNPASLIRLADGRMCVTYGVRAEPYRMCAKLSSDGGASWSPEIVLRDDGGSHDIGYPRSVQREDGKVVTVYYFWDRKTGPERYITATIWDPDNTDQ
jgi:hypothetical protein